MGKKVKYEMCVNTYNLDGNVFPITKRVFTDTLNNYKKQIHESETNNKECDTGYELGKIDVKTKEYPQHKETLYAIFDSGTAICLRKLECKPGYRWK